MADSTKVATDKAAAADADKAAKAAAAQLEADQAAEAEATAVADETAARQARLAAAPARPEPEPGAEGYEDTSNGKIRANLPIPNPQEAAEAGAKARGKG